MRPSIVTTSVIAAMAISQGADAGFIGAVIARVGAAAARAGVAAAAASRSATVAIGKAIAKAAKKVPASGVTSGMTSGTISSSAGIGLAYTVGKKKQSRDSTKMRRTIHSQKLYERELMGRPDAREDDGPGQAPEGIKQTDWDRCYSDAMDAHIVINDSVDGDNTVEIDGLPPSCMSLRVWAASNPAGAKPEVCGHACLKYKNLSHEEYAALLELVAHAHHK